MFLVLLIATVLHVSIMATLAMAWRNPLTPFRVEIGEWRVESLQGTPDKSELHSQLSTLNSQQSKDNQEALTPSPDPKIRELITHNSEPITPSSELITLNSKLLRGLSLLIAAHNEAENLEKFLPFALNQDFAGEYEVIVALDRCTDASAQVVARMREQYKHLRVIDISATPAGWTGKKHALNLAIQAAKYECLALTDADCELPPSWLAGISAEFEKGNDLVLGVSPYAPAPSLLNLLIRFETWITALLFIGLARLGLPYMAVGRSIAYRKTWFQNAGGFTEIAHRLSGDDDLLVNRAAHLGKIGYSIAVENQVISVPKASWRSWLAQKIRHGSAGTAYKSRSLLILSIIHGVHLIFYLSLVVVLCLQSSADWALVIYLARTVTMIAILAICPWRHKLALVIAFPLLDLLYLAYIVLLMPATAFIQPKWKNNHGGSVQEYT